LVETPELLTEYSDAKPGPFDDGWTIAKLADFSAPRDFGRLLYHMTRSLAPQSAIELGTNIGLSAAYLATGMAHNGTGRLTTLEASEIRLQLARHVFDDLGLNNVATVPGYFADTLIPTLEEVGPVDFAFVDGDHREESTLGYFDTISGYTAGGGVFMFDDIRWSDGMFRAWSQISRDARTQLAVDLGRVGLAVLA
jgi:predicted O-methyltransferase YrrM